MKFVRFIENRYQELTLQAEKGKDVFDACLDSEIKAAHQMLSGYRWILKWFLMPKVFYDFICVNLKLRPEPEPVLLNRIKATEQAKKVAQQMEVEGKVTVLKPEIKVKPSEAPSR